MDKKFYDLLIIFNVEAKDQKRGKVIAEVTEIIGKNDGEIEKIDEWGIRTLSYPIKKHTTGFYFLIRFRAMAEALSLISKVLKTSELVLRFLITKRKNSLPKEEENKKEVE